MKSNPNNSVGTIVGVMVYASTGVLQPMIIDYLRMNNALGRKALLLPTLCNVIGMACCGILVNSSVRNKFLMELRSSRSLRRSVLITAAIDLCSGMLLTLGLLLTGGAVFVVLYNSCPAWTALISRVMLGTKMDGLGIMGVVLVCFGLVASVLGIHSKEGDDVDEIEDQDENSSKTVMLGSIVILIGSLLHSLMFVLSDMFLRSPRPVQSGDGKGGVDSEINLRHDNPVPGALWSCVLGLIESVFMLFWVTFVSFTFGFQENGADGEASVGVVDVKAIIPGLIFLVIVDAFHAAAFFALLQEIGAVGSALLKGVQTVLVVGLSALLFCPYEVSQCPTKDKIVSTLLVLLGVLCYSFRGKVSAKNNRSKEKEK